MAALRGNIREWVEIEPNRWRREVGGEWVEDDGIITLRDGLSFAEYYQRRTTPAPPGRDPAAEMELAGYLKRVPDLVGAVQSLMAEIAELKDEVATLKSARLTKSA